MIDEAPPTPVFLFTGFLGSGKTTVLARLIRRDDLADTAVIVNEFGEVGLDHHLVARGEEDNVVLLENGCLCCAVGDSLGETLSYDLYYRRERGEVPFFSRVIIETTGLADPGPILRTLIADRVMMRRYRIGALVTMVDGVLGEAQLHKHHEAQQQAAMADKIVLTKRDLAPADTLAATMRAVRALNRNAEVLIAESGEVDPAALLAPIDTAHDAPEAGHGHSHSGAINTIFLAVPDGVSWEQYAGLVETLRETLGARLLRAKGLLRIGDEPEPQVIQGVQHMFAPPAPLQRGQNSRTGLVLIGEGLDCASLAAALAPYGVVA